MLLTSPYFDEETLFLLFWNRKTTYLNAPWPTGGCIIHHIIIFLT